MTAQAFVRPDDSTYHEALGATDVQVHAFFGLGQQFGEIQLLLLRAIVEMQVHPQRESRCQDAIEECHGSDVTNRQRGIEFAEHARNRGSQVGNRGIA